MGAPDPCRARNSDHLLQLRPDAKKMLRRVAVALPLRRDKLERVADRRRIEGFQLGSQRFRKLEHSWSPIEARLGCLIIEPILPLIVIARECGLSNLWQQIGWPGSRCFARPGHD